MKTIARIAGAVLFATLITLTLPFTEGYAATLAGRAVGVRDDDTLMAVKYTRSGTAKRIFRAHHPCPATGRHRGACPGYIIDHVTPLCAGGDDSAQNMQWQTIEEGKAKDRLERRQCARTR